MFSCCCVNKKALKKEQQNVESEREGFDASGKNGKDIKCDINNSIKLPQKPQATDVASYKSPTKDKSNSSDDDNNLSGLILSDGLVGEVELF